MLFVFQVDAGKMRTFEMNLATESVEVLKWHIENLYKIPASKQVLLISGGEHLDPSARVCSYSAGTDTNPIFLFTKPILDPTRSTYQNYIPDSEASAIITRDLIELKELTNKVNESKSHPPTYITLTRRVKMAHDFSELSKDKYRVCEKLVHEQHLQQQGWAAVVANLEDISVDLRQRLEICKIAYKDYMTDRDNYLDVLKHFKDDLILLQKIPILPALIESEKALVPDDDDNNDDDNNDNDDNLTTDNNDDNGQNEGSKRKSLSLLQWILKTNTSLDELFDYCSMGLTQMNEEVFEQLDSEAIELLNNAEKTDMKEVKGLSERLSGLEDLMREAKKYVQEQSDLANSFRQNQKVLETEKDKTSILPDLCNSHCKHLAVMLQNYEQLADIKRRCIKAKDELCSNLNHRLRWLIYVELGLIEIDNKLVVYHETLTCLQKQLEVLRQIHLAPATYLSAVAEVVRRRNFSQSFLLWASEMACHLLTIHNEELTKRKDFQSQFDGHFLNALFPGMDDLPPSFATQAPSIFDTSLPKIDQDDVNRLKDELPEFADNLIVTSTSIIPNVLMIRSVEDDNKINNDDGGIVVNDNDVDKDVEEKLLEIVKEIGLESNMDQTLLKAIERSAISAEAAAALTAMATANTYLGLPYLKDFDRGCESETDTEEFEKVGQSPLLDLHFDKDLTLARAVAGRQDASTSTEDNLQISQSEYEKLKLCLIKMAQISTQTIHHLKTELENIKTKLISDRTVIINQYCDNASKSITHITTKHEQNQRELIQRLTIDHELEICDFRKIAQGKNEEIKRLRGCIASIDAELKTLISDNAQLNDKIALLNCTHSNEIDILKQQIVDLEVAKEKSVKEVTDRFKNEVESIRCRFKLMTMERSPSDNSLERIESSSLSNPETMLMQMTENFEVDKEMAISEALTKEQDKWREILSREIAKMRNQCDMEKIEICQRIADDKDKQIDVLRERADNLNLECIKHKNTIQQLVDYDPEVNNHSELYEKIACLKKTNADLEIELNKWKSGENLIDMNASVAVCDGKVDATTSPVRTKKMLSRSQISSTKSSKLKIESCKSGDLVLILWEPIHKSFKILQESNYMYFVHTDCLESLGLEVDANGEPNKHYCTGEVVDKEYCHARKPENRYKVPKGAKFFRVRVKPLLLSVKESALLPRGDQTSLELCHMSQSHTGSTTTLLASSTTTLITTASDATESLTYQQQPSPETTTIIALASSSAKSLPPEIIGDDTVIKSTIIDDDFCHSDDSNIVVTTLQQQTVVDVVEVEKATELTENYEVDDGLSNVTATDKLKIVQATNIDHRLRSDCIIT